MQIIDSLKKFYINLTHARPQYSINDAATIYQVMNDFHHKINSTVTLVKQLAEEISARDKKLTALINAQTGTVGKQAEQDKALILEQIKIISGELQRALTQSNSVLLEKIAAHHRQYQGVESPPPRTAPALRIRN